MSNIEVVWPLGKKANPETDTVARVEDFSGKTIAAIWDYLFRGDEIFRIVTEKMAERFPGMKVVSYEVFGNNHGSRQHELIKQVPDKLRQHKVDAVISLVGA
jgi:hypothetical protein